jgi:hypothetical protein
MKFSIKQVVFLISSVILIICYNYYLTWKFYPLRSATASEKLNFKNYQYFNHGIVDEFNKKVYVLFYGSNPSTLVGTNKVEIKSNPQVKNKDQGCVGFGNESCLDKVRERFTGKNILSEKYLGDGQFGISFLDASRGESYNAKVSTDCNCKILNLDVEIMR